MRALGKAGNAKAGKRLVRLEGAEFVRRFLLHVLPGGRGGSSAFATMGYWQAPARASSCQQHGRLCRCPHPTRWSLSRPRRSWCGWPRWMRLCALLQGGQAQSGGQFGGAALSACTRGIRFGGLPGAAVMLLEGEFFCESLLTTSRRGREPAARYGKRCPSRSRQTVAHGIHWQRWARTWHCTATRNANPRP